MQFRPEEYFRTSLERMSQARKLLEFAGANALAMYCGGLAVECMLRAFRGKIDSEFEARHDLNRLLKASRLLQVSDEQMRSSKLTERQMFEFAQQLRSSMNEVASLWHNSLRFTSEASLRAFLVRIERVQGLKGDPLRKNALDLLNAAQTIVNQGLALWTSNRK